MRLSTTSRPDSTLTSPVLFYAVLIGLVVAASFFTPLIQLLAD